MSDSENGSEDCMRMSTSANSNGYEDEGIDHGFELHYDEFKRRWSRDFPFPPINRKSVMMSGAVRQSLMFNQEQLDHLSTVFNTIDGDGNGFISMDELGEALKQCGIEQPGYRVRDLIMEHDTHIKDGKLDIEEFKAVYEKLKCELDMGYKDFVKRSVGIEVIEGTSQKSVEGTTHSVRKEEQVAFSNWINRNLAEDPDCADYLPLDPETRDLYTKCKNGIIFCKMINKSQENTIDERAINKGKLSIYLIHENMTLALNSARAIGCNVVNIGPEDLRAGKPHLVLGLLWQIIRIKLLSDINLHENPNLAALLQEDESLEDFMKLSPEQILYRWVNFHLARSTCDRQIENLTGDIKDSVAYIHLLNQIAPRGSGVSLMPEHEADEYMRAEKMLQEADKIGCRQFVSPDEVVSGNYKLNLAFVANLYNMYPALDKADVDVDIEIVPETREEKMYRNWMNSMGVSPYVNHLYSDLNSAIVIFQLYDIINPGMVEWKRVHSKFNEMRILMEKIENCNYAVELGKQSKFSLVGIDGKDIYDGNNTLTLALVWQLMKAYTLSILTKLSDPESNHPIVDYEIVTWVNDRLKAARKTSRITGFNDPAISDGMVILDLVDAIKPGSIKYNLIKTGHTEQEKLDNAKYAISMARKIGAGVYALPEDIVEVKQKMVMTVFACLMIKDYQPQ